MNGLMVKGNDLYKKELNDSADFKIFPLNNDRGDYWIIPITYSAKQVIKSLSDLLIETCEDLVVPGIYLSLVINKLWELGFNLE